MLIAGAHAQEARNCRQLGGTKSCGDNKGVLCEDREVVMSRGARAGIRSRLWSLPQRALAAPEKDFGSELWDSNPGRLCKELIHRTFTAHIDLSVHGLWHITISNIFIIRYSVAKF